MPQIPSNKTKSGTIEEQYQTPALKRACQPLCAPFATSERRCLSQPWKSPRLSRRRISFVLEFCVAMSRGVLPWCSRKGLQRRASESAEAVCEAVCEAVS